MLENKDSGGIILKKISGWKGNWEIFSISFYMGNEVGLANIDNFSVEYIYSYISAINNLKKSSWQTKTDLEKSTVEDIVKYSYLLNSLHYDIEEFVQSMAGNSPCNFISDEWTLGQLHYSGSEDKINKALQKIEENSELTDAEKVSAYLYFPSICCSDLMNRFLILEMNPAILLKYLFPEKDFNNELDSLNLQTWQKFDAFSEETQKALDNWFADREAQKSIKQSLKLIIETYHEQLEEKPNFAKKMQDYKIQLLGNVNHKQQKIHQELNDRYMPKSINEKANIQDLTDTEENILEALDNDTLIGQSNVTNQKYQKSKDKEPLPPKVALVYDMLLELPAHKALTAPQILDKLYDEHNITISEDTLRKSYLKKLKDHGVVNKRKVGYYIPKD